MSEWTALLTDLIGEQQAKLEAQSLFKKLGKPAHNFEVRQVGKCVHVRGYSCVVMCALVCYGVSTV